MNRKSKLVRLYGMDAAVNKLPKQLYNGVSKRLGMINQLSPKENLSVSIRLSLIFTVASIAYFSIVKFMVNALWYHNIMLIASTVLFFMVIVELYFESLEKAIKRELAIL